MLRCSSMLSSLVVVCVCSAPSLHPVFANMLFNYVFLTNIWPGRPCDTTDCIASTKLPFRPPTNKIHRHAYYTFANNNRRGALCFPVICPSVCPSVRWHSTSRDAMSLYSVERFRWTRHKFSTLEWELARKFSRPKVKGQGYSDFRSKIRRHHIVAWPQFPQGRENSGDSRTFKVDMELGLLNSLFAWVFRIFGLKWRFGGKIGEGVVR